MLKVGLTGGIGSGKSTVVRLFKQYGVSVIDADLVAKALVEPGEPALNEISQCFGSDILTANGQLNRALLKEKVFDNVHLLNQLESILHPRIRQSITLQIQELIAAAKSDSPRYLIVDIPLLVEKGYQSLFDEIVVVDCTEQQQSERTLMRDVGDREQAKEKDKKQGKEHRKKHGEERGKIKGKVYDKSESSDQKPSKPIDKKMIENIISKQATRKERLEIATKTLDNSGSIGALDLQVDELHQLFNQ